MGHVEDRKLPASVGRDLLRQHLRPYLCCGALLAVLAMGAAPLLAQTADCSIVASRNPDELSPSLAGKFADAPLQADLRREYAQSDATPPPSDLAARVAHTLDAAKSSGNACAIGMASLLLGDREANRNFTTAQKAFADAAAAFEQADAPLGTAEVLRRTAELHIERGEQAQANADYTRAIAIYTAQGRPLSALISEVGRTSVTESPDYAGLARRAAELHNACIQGALARVWGQSFFDSSNFAAADLHYREAGRFYAACPQKLAERADLETIWGMNESDQGRTSAAIAHYRRGVELERRLGDSASLSQALGSLARFYEGQHQPERAIPLYKQALEAIEKNGSPGFIGLMESNLGSAYLQAHQAAQAVPLIVAANATTKSDALRCLRFDNLSQAYLDLGRNQDALEAAEASNKACTATHNDRSVERALEDSADAYLRLDQLDDALRDAQQAVSMLEQFRTHLVRKDAYKQGYLEYNHHAYDLLITILVRLKRYDEALEASEQGRARAFLDLLASRPAATGAAAPPEGSPHSLEALRKQLVDSPAQAAPMRAADVRAQAERLHSTLLLYWTTHDSLFTFVVAPGKPTFALQQPITESELAKSIAAVQPAESSGGVGAEIVARGGSHVRILQPENSWKHLYALLIAPVAAQLPTEDGSLLTIVPSGSLFQLPFAALQNPAGRYLLERYRVHTIPAASLLSFTERNQQLAHETRPRYLFLANPARLPLTPTGQRLPPLPGTASEVSAIAHLLPAAEVHTLEGQQAAIAPLLRELPNTTVLHLATHAIVSDTEPFNSFLALDDRTGEGRLSLAEIYGLRLRTSLVVLSACRTGRGHVTGDGVEGLSRAFFYAGSASVLTTLWDVADRPTAMMLPRFYRALDAGRSPSEALRSAQLSMLGDLRAGRISVETLAGQRKLPPSPAFWAAFSLAGEP
ncbi:MAG TPA: CHAT domain-containing tetratricopeptide repeat protein [Acidobacteriaceae bacterium]|nr:CHAT domain-containing tetratricopeptide repeat protein [Acidobacteriaceae bacterium]